MIGQKHRIERQIRLSMIDNRYYKKYIKCAFNFESYTPGEIETIFYIPQLYYAVCLKFKRIYFSSGWFMSKLDVIKILK